MCERLAIPVVLVYVGAALGSMNIADCSKAGRFVRHNAGVLFVAVAPAAEDVLS
jgi:hypothetical protein